MDVVHVVQSDSPRQRYLYNLLKFEMKFSDGYDSDGEMGLWNVCVYEEGPQYSEEDEVQYQYTEEQIKEEYEARGIRNIQYRACLY